MPNGTIPDWVDNPPVVGATYTSPDGTLAVTYKGDNQFVAVPPSEILSLADAIAIRDAVDADADAAAASQAVASAAAVSALNFPDGQVVAHYNALASIERKATLSLDFADEQYGFYDLPTLTFKRAPVAEALTVVRASTATASHPQGLVTYPVNGLRIAYDPVTGERLGALVERGATNLTLNSETKTIDGGTNTSGFIVSGIKSYTRFVEDTSSQNRNMLSDTVTTTATHTLSIDLLPLSGGATRWVVLRNATTAIGASYNVSTGIFDTTSVGVTTFKETLYNGIVRVSASIPFITGESANIRLRNSNSVSLGAYTGDGFSGVVFGAVQLTATAFPVSYIPTTTAAAIRAADDVSRALNVVNNNEGTLLVEFMCTGLSVDGLTKPIIRLNNSGNAANRGFGVYISGTNGAINIIARDSTVNNFASSGVVATSNTMYRVALSFGSGLLKGSVNGGNIFSAALTANLATFVTHVFLQGGNGITGSFGWAPTTYSQALYIPRALTDAQLITWSRQ